MIGCREDPKIPSSEQEQAGTAEQTSIQGLYLLNEGNMGSNKATLDYYDYSQALYWATWATTCKSMVHASMP